MPAYDPPIRDMLFVLQEMLGVGRGADVPGGADLSDDLLTAILEESGRFARDVAAPLNPVGDAEGCKWRDGAVTTPPGFRQAYDLYVAGGWPGLNASTRYGGQGLPGAVGMPVTEMLTSANCGFSFYPGLIHHAMRPLEHFAAEDIRAIYLPRMVAGQWGATMELTEAHCGSDLGMLRTRAAPAPDGAYRVSGTKIFITAGEHDLTDNIVHLVLARIDGAPAGVKGISLFLVPKFIPDASGNPGPRNQVRCSRIEAKMGIHGSATCEMTYEGAQGFLVGEPNRGLAAMFTMMNDARIGCGLQGVALAEVAYQNAVAYARTRLQGRAPGASDAANRPADPIILHADVRRMLLRIRSFVEGGRALVYWARLVADIAEQHRDPGARERAAAMLEVLTPIVKSYLSDKGVECTSLAMQCLGGHGYVREWGLEQYYRDARIAPLYEGTNGIQAMDLVSRKLSLGGGRGINALFEHVDSLCAEASGEPRLVRPAATLAEALELARSATQFLQQADGGRSAVAGAVAHDFLNLVGLLAMGAVWLRMWRISLARETLSRDEGAFHSAKAATARFFFATELPLARTLFARVTEGAEPTLSFATESF